MLYEIVWQRKGLERLGAAESRKARRRLETDLNGWRLENSIALHGKVTQGLERIGNSGMLPPTLVGGRHLAKDAVRSTDAVTNFS